MKLSALILLSIFAANYPQAAKAVTLDHRWGKTVIEHPAKRIVTISYNGIDTLLVLGLEPIAYRTWYGGDENGIWPWTKRLKSQTIKTTVLRGEINLVQIIRLQPDLIEAMYSGISRAQYQTLSNIIPVLPSAKDKGDFGATWDDMLLNVGAATGRKDKALEVINRINAQISELRARHPNWIGKTAVIANPIGPLIFSDTDPRMALLKRLGFSLPKATQNFATDGFYFRLDRELTEPLDADVVLWTETQNANNALNHLPLWKTTRAHKEQREIFLDANLTAALSYSSPLSIPYALRRLEPMLEKALGSKSMGTNLDYPLQEDNR